MTELFPSAHVSLFLALSLAGWLAAGMLLGAFHFVTLRWVVSGLLSERRGWLLPVAIEVLRFSVLTIGMAAIVRWFGALSLLSATAGTLAMRSIVLRIGLPS